MNVAELREALKYFASDVEVVVGCEMTYSNAHPVISVRFAPEIGRVKIGQNDREQSRPPRKTKKWQE